MSVFTEAELAFRRPDHRQAGAPQFHRGEGERAAQQGGDGQRGGGFRQLAADVARGVAQLDAGQVAG